MAVKHRHLHDPSALLDTNGVPVSSRDVVRLAVKAGRQTTAAISADTNLRPRLVGQHLACLARMGEIKRILRGLYDWDCAPEKRPVPRERPRPSPIV